MPRPQVLVPMDTAVEMTKREVRIQFVPPIVIQANGVPIVPPCAGQFVIAGDPVKIQKPGGPPAGSQQMMPVMCVLNDLSHGASRQVIIEQSGGWITEQDIQDCVDWWTKLIALTGVACD